MKLKRLKTTTSIMTVGFAAAMSPCIGNAGALLDTDFGIDINGGRPALVHPNSDAAKTTFFNRFGTVATQDFESLSGYSTNTLGGGLLSASNQISGGRFPISGSLYLQFSTPAATDSFAISNSAGAYGFGFYGIDVGDFGEHLSIRLNFSDSTSLLVKVPHSADSSRADGSVFYFGVIGDTPISTVDFINSGGNGTAILAFDDITGGFNPIAVPEPGSFALIGLGLAGLLAARRRKDW